MKKQGAKELYIMDARSYAAALSNTAIGGGYESVENYGPNVKIEWLDLGNIHDVKRSFHCMLNSPFSDEGTKDWKTTMKNILHAARHIAKKLLGDACVLIVGCRALF